MAKVQSKSKAFFQNIIINFLKPKHHVIGVLRSGRVYVWSPVKVCP